MRHNTGGNTAQKTFMGYETSRSRYLENCNVDSGSHPLEPGSRVELAGLKSTVLNGCRGCVAPVGQGKTPRKGRVKVRLDGSARVLSVKLVNLKAAPSKSDDLGRAAASDAAQFECRAAPAIVAPKPQSNLVNFKFRPPVLLCESWKFAPPARCSADAAVGPAAYVHTQNPGARGAPLMGGCKQPKPGATPKDNPGIPVKVSARGCTAACFICLDDRDEPKPRPLGCACRGHAGYAHPACVEAAALAGGTDNEWWTQCMTCKQDFTGTMRLELAWKWWTRVCDELGTHRSRWMSSRWMGAAINLGTSLDRQGQHAEAAAMFREVHGVQQRMLGPEHPDTVSTAMYIAKGLRIQGEHAAAAALFREAHEVQTRLLGPEHENTLCAAVGLASVLYEQGEHAAAAAMYREGRETQNRVLGPANPKTLSTASNLANVLYEQGKYTAAEAIYRETLEVQKRVLGEKHPDTLRSAKCLATTLDEQGQNAEVCNT